MVDFQEGNVLLNPPFWRNKLRKAIFQWISLKINKLVKRKIITENQLLLTIVDIFKLLYTISTYNEGSLIWNVNSLNALKYFIL